jgi:hypothetical protein
MVGNSAVVLLNVSSLIAIDAYLLPGHQSSKRPFNSILGIDERITNCGWISKTAISPFVPAGRIFVT